MAELINSFFGKSSDITEISNILKSKGGDLRSNIDEIISRSRPWPQTMHNPGFSNTSGFLPPLLITPIKAFKFNEPISLDTLNSNDSINNIDKLPNTIKYGEYEYEDWIGQKITKNGLIPIETVNRFNESKNLPKNITELERSPYSMRDSYLIFNDNSTDYFKHGLQILNNLTPIENPDNNSNLRLGQFTSTPSEQSDPVMFGFEIIIDDISSPLLNGSVNDFLNNYSGIYEIGSKIPVYEDFKQQFIKLFKTKSTVKINTSTDSLSNSDSTYASTENSKSLRQNGKKAYMNYYLKKIGGLGNLYESNIGDTKKYLPDYRKDLITLEFTEDVSLSIGTLTHLYKLLYWSKPNGKSLVPDNLLRFNCDIIISECRNFNKVKKGVENGNIEIIKDNLSRYIYSLRECQFFFNKMPHSDEIDLGNISIFESSVISFDYKYSTTKFEKFMPTFNGNGKYVGYDGGSLWKVGNPGARSTRGTQSSNIDISLPKFFTSGENKYGQNGINNTFVTNTFGIRLPETPSGFTSDEKVLNQENNREQISDLQSLKNSANNSINNELNKLKVENKSKLESFSKGKLLNQLTEKASPVLGNYIERLKDKTVKSAKRELSMLVNGRVNLLSRTLNKLAIGFVGRKGISPPQNVYFDKEPLSTALGNIKDRFFYDIRNELTNFAGDSMGSFLKGASFKF